MDFHTRSYQKHQENKHVSQISDSWRRFDTVDYWRHERMYKNLLPILESHPNSSWLTVGDGRYGTDANFLLRNNARAVATDINDELLTKAKDDGFITEFKNENAEKLSFQDAQFDFVLCKEAYHHFPRPPLALYEMLRVCKNGVILIEPNDAQIVNPFRINYRFAQALFFQSIKNKVKSLAGRKQYVPAPNYESIGNYVYSISMREMEKVALGMNLPAIAFKNMNDVYLEGVEHEPISTAGPLFKKIKRQLQKSDLITKKYGDRSGLLVVVIFKAEPTENCTKKLLKDGYQIEMLKRNPYA